MQDISTTPCVWGRLEYATAPKGWNFDPSGKGAETCIEVIDLVQKKYHVGRNPASDLKLSLPIVSNKHCVLYTKCETVRVENNENEASSNKQLKLKVYIQDLKSTNGTYVNGTELQKGATRELRDGDLVSLSVRTNHRVVPYYRLTTLPLNPDEVDIILSKSDDKKDDTHEEWKKRQTAQEELQRHNKDLRKELDNVLQELHDANVKLNKSGLEISELNISLKSAQEKLEEEYAKNEQMKELEMEFKSCRDHLAEKDLELKNLSVENESLEKQKLSLESLQSNLKENMEEKDRILEKAQQNFESMRENFQEQKKINEALNEKLSNQKTMENAKVQLESQVENLKKEIASQKLLLESTQTKNRDLEKHVSQLETQINEQVGKNETEGKQRQDLVNEMSKLKQLHADYQSRQETEAARNKHKLAAVQNDKKLMEEHFSSVFEKISHIKRIKIELQSLLHKLDEPIKIAESQSRVAHMSEDLLMPGTPIEKEKDDKSMYDEAPKIDAKAVQQEEKEQKEPNSLKRKRTDTGVDKPDAKEARHNETDDEEGDYDSELEATQKTECVEPGSDVEKPAESKITRFETITEDENEEVSKESKSEGEAINDGKEEMEAEPTQKSERNDKSEDEFSNAEDSDEE